MTARLDVTLQNRIELYALVVVIVVVVVVVVVVVAVVAAAVAVAVAAVVVRRAYTRRHNYRVTSAPPSRLSLSKQKCLH